MALKSWHEYWSEPVLALPLAVLKHYKRLGLSDVQMMLILHLWGMRLEGHALPSLKTLGERMQLDETALAATLQWLVEHRFVRITESVDADGRLSEMYDLGPFFETLSPLLAEGMNLSTSPLASTSRKLTTVKAGEEQTLPTLMQLLEQKLARPLSPIDTEIVMNWLDKDAYSFSLIEAALEEALLLGKNSIRYMDRLLFEWTKRGFKTLDTKVDMPSSPDGAQKQTDDSKRPANEHFPQVNWLEDDD